MNLRCQGLENYLCLQLMKIKGVFLARASSMVDQIELEVADVEVLKEVKKQLKNMGCSVYGEPSAMIKESKVYIGSMLGRVVSKKSKVESENETQLDESDELPS